jgi:class 3 adenylate cyclase
VTEIEPTPMEAARQAIERFAWDEAARLLHGLDGAGGLSADGLERLANAEWWLGNLASCIGIRERAYELLSKSGDRRGAARVALGLATNYSAKLASSRAQGWHRRAIRLLQDEPDCVERGYLLLEQVWTRYRREAPEAARELAKEAVELGARHGDRDLEMTALADLGRVLVHAGETDEGMAMVEEASAAALGGELGPYATSVVFCLAIATSRELTDLGRAGEWSDAATQWCERQAITGFPGVCRVYRAQVMRLRGAWSDAEIEIRRACGELRPFAPKTAASAFHELGEIRLRVGDFEGAGDAFWQARQLTSSAQPGLARLQIAQGKAALAVRGLRETIDDDNLSRLDRAPLLAVLVDAAIATDDLRGADEAARELADTAAQYGTPLLLAAAAFAQGSLELTHGRPSDAVKRLRHALHLYEEVDLPYEAAESRVALAQAYRANGDPEAAVLELAAAREAFERLGAIRGAQAAAAQLASLTDATGGGVDEGSGVSAPERTFGSAGGLSTAKRTFMFTDIVASTPLVEVIGDEAWHDIVCWHDDTLRALFTKHGGEVLDHAGDGFAVAFEDQNGAIDCAVAIQRTLARHRREHGFAPPVRIGVHTAEVRRGRGGYRGKGVHVAARIAATAGAGEIVASATTVSQAAAYPTSEPEPVSLKGVADPVPVATVNWR